MQGSVAISPSPIMLDSLIFRQKLGLCLATASVHQVSNKMTGSSGGTGGGCASTARCLFGPPDPKQAKDLVKEVELKNALNFGKRFNFDIVNGEPFPHAKKMKMSQPAPPPKIVNDSDEENVAISGEESEEEDGGYIWTETYDEDYMAMCNRHNMSPSMNGPNRHTVSLLIAPIVPNHDHFSYLSSSSLSSQTSISSPLESPPGVSSEETSSSADDLPEKSVSSPTANALSSPETNNNITESNKAHQHQRNDKSSTKRNNRINSLQHNPQSLHHHQPSAKKSGLASAHHILNRVLKHAVMRKPRKSVITDYLQIRRLRNEAGKKQ